MIGQHQKRERVRERKRRATERERERRKREGIAFDRFPSSPFDPHQSSILLLPPLREVPDLRSQNPNPLALPHRRRAPSRRCGRESADRILFLRLASAASRLQDPNPRAAGFSFFCVDLSDSSFPLSSSWLGGSLSGISCS